MLELQTERRGEAVSRTRRVGGDVGADAPREDGPSSATTEAAGSASVVARRLPRRGATSVSNCPRTARSFHATSLRLAVRMASRSAVTWAKITSGGPSGARAMAWDMAMGAPSR
jgi:hypothetical protein